MRKGRWAIWRPTHRIGAKVSGKTLGIIGFVCIAQAMTKRAHFDESSPLVDTFSFNEIVSDYLYNIFHRIELCTNSFHE